MNQKVIIVTLTLTSAIFFTSTSVTFANHRAEVLGEATTSAIEMPATIEGPGLILPDSPFYFMDQWKQKVRVTLAFSPEAKAKVQSDIAGERFAEVRFMLEKNDKKGAEKALAGMAESTENAAKSLDEAKLKGVNTIELARKINEQIKRREESLADVEEDATGEVKASVMVTRASLDTSKVNVEDHLAPSELQQEIENRLERNAMSSLKDASNSARVLERSIEVLTMLASEAAQKNQTQRQEALNDAIETKNTKLQKEVEARGKRELEKEKKAIEIKKEEAETARKMVNLANEASIRMEAAKRAKEALKEKSESISQTESEKER